MLATSSLLRLRGGQFAHGGLLAGRCLPVAGTSTDALLLLPSASGCPTRWLSRRWEFQNRKKRGRADSDKSDGEGGKSAWASWTQYKTSSSDGSSWTSEQWSSGRSAGGESKRSRHATHIDDKPRSERPKTAYEILGVGEEAEDAEIKSSYHRLARLNHPDLHPNDPHATVRFQEITTAYEKIKDSGARDQYRFQRRIEKWTSTDDTDATVIIDEEEDQEQELADETAPARPFSDVVAALGVYARATLDDIKDIAMYARWKQWMPLALASWRVVRPTTKLLWPTVFYLYFPLFFKIWVGYVGIRMGFLAVLAMMTSPTRVWNRSVARLVRRADRRRRKL